MNQRLRQYLDSGKTQLPSDADKFLPRNEFQYKCVFCVENLLEASSTFDVPLFSIRDKSYTHTSLCCCYDCHSFISETSIQTSDFMHYPANIERKRRLLYSCLDINTGFAIDPEIDRFYTHLHSIDTFAGPGSNDICFFCETSGIPTPYRQPTDISYLLIPVTHSLRLTGGRIPYCDHSLCTQSANDYKYLLADLLKYNKAAKQHDFLRVVCPVCQTAYYITSSEIQHRQALSMSTNHFEPSWNCPECAYNNLRVYERARNTNLFPAEPGVERTRILSRFMISNCSICGEVCTTDLTLTDFSLSNLMWDNKLVCIGCSDHIGWLKSDSVFQIMPQSGQILEISSDSTEDNIIFFVHTLKKGVVITEVDKIITHTGNIAEALSKAINTKYK